MRLDKEQVLDAEGTRKPLTSEERTALAHHYQDPKVRDIARIHALRLANHDQANADDLLQESWRKAAQGFRGFKRSTAIFSTWFHQIITNTFRDRLRSKKRETQEIPPEEDPVLVEHRYPDPERAFASKEWISILFQAIEKLSSRHQAIANLRYAQDLDVQDIAHTLKIPVNTVKTSLWHIRARLRKILSEDAPEINDAIERWVSPGKSNDAAVPEETENE